jgi:C_GCAxxG_C_C family probable redox protein
VLEEFGLGNLEIVKALSPFPGFGGTGRICGAVSGGLVSLGLYFGSDDLMNYDGNRASIAAARVFLTRFEQTLGSLQCRDIQTTLLGRYFDPSANKDDAEAFIKAKGYEKCTIAAGIGARLAAEIIIENLTIVPIPPN